MTPTPEELEFTAGLVEIEIIPKFDHPKMELITAEVGPFVAGIPVKVPLWLAIHFRSQSRCSVVCPNWLSTGFLGELKVKEMATSLFEKMPTEEYMQIAKMLFEACPEDIPDADKVKELVKDIWDARLSKLRTAVLDFIEKGAIWAKVDKLCQIEMCAIRPYFTHSLDHLERFRKALDESKYISARMTVSEVRRN